MCTSPVFSIFDKVLVGLQNNLSDTYIMDTCIINDEYMHHSCTDTCIIDTEVDKEVLVLVNFAGVTWPERLKGAKDKVKRPEGPPTRSGGSEGPKTFSHL